MDDQRIDAVYGETAQKTAAAIVGGYAIFVGFQVGDFLCAALGGGT